MSLVLVSMHLWLRLSVRQKISVNQRTNTDKIHVANYGYLVDVADFIDPNTRFKSLNFDLKKKC